MSSWFGLPSLGYSKGESSPPVYRRRAGPGAAFTASKCPQDGGLENSCELPFGFVWTPMAESNDQEDENESKKMAVIDCGGDSLPPVLCLACLAYINPFAELDKKTGSWTCPLCGHENILPKKLLRDGSKIMTALTSSCVEYRQVVPKPDPDEEEKKDDGRFAGYAEKEDCITYALVVDENLSPKDGQAIAPTVEEILKENSSASKKTRICLITFGKSVSMYQLGLSGFASADIYVPSDFDEDHDRFDREIEKRSYIADVQLGDFTSLRMSLSSIFGITVDEDDDPSASNSTGFFTSSSSRMAMLSKKKAARLRKEENSNGDQSNVPTKSPWVKLREESSSGYSKRCTGKAIQCALDLVSDSSSSRTSRIILFTNGCPNSGDGSVVDPKDLLEKSKNKRGKRAAHDSVDTDMLQKSVEYFDILAGMAVSYGIGIDVICCGVTELAMPVYQAMVESSGGYVMPLITLDSPQLKENLKHVLANTYMSRSKYIPEEFVGVDGAECILDIRTDSFVTPTQLCGSGEVLTDLHCEIVETERSAFEEGSRLAEENGLKVKGLPSEKAMEISMTRIQMGRVDPLNTITVLLEIDDTIAEEDEYAFFQLVSRYISSDGDVEITRVFSFKFHVAEDVGDFLGSVNDEAMSVALAKVAVYRSLHGREETDDTRDMTAAGDTNTQEKLAYDTQLDLDATIQRISGAFRLLDLEKQTKRRCVNIPLSNARELASFDDSLVSHFFF